MRDHEYAVDRDAEPLTTAFAPVFNTAVPFIDRHTIEGRSSKAAIICEGDTVTYGELAEKVNRAGNALKGLGLHKGERVLLVIRDCPAFYYLFWGAIKAGLVPVPLNTLLRAADYRYMIEDSGAAALVFSGMYTAEVEPALASAGHKPVAAVSEEEFLRSMEQASTELAPHPSAPADDCFWLYSSGSTGRPKGAVHAHRDILVSCATYADETLGIREDDVCFSAAKLFFAYGLGNAMTFPLWKGATAVLSDQRPTPQMTFDIIREHRPTLFFGVPTLYASQLAALEFQDVDLSPVRLCVSAGEALPAGMFKRWKERTGLTILDGIGSTEAQHIFISNLPHDVRPGTSGRVVRGYQAKIVDETGAELPPGRTGQLMIRGDSTAGYYWNKPEKTAETMVDGWLDTGDTYLLDEEGYFHYCGRNDDMLKVGGIWCSPFEIECRLVEHPKVLEAAVVGRADPQGLVKPMAYVVLKEPSDASPGMEEELKFHCKSGLAPYKYPRWFQFLPELPKTATGKIRRFLLREQCS